MYGGRQKIFSNHSSRSLVGVLGITSVLALPLLHTTDLPQEMGMYAVLDLPVVQMVSDEEGEIHAGVGSGITFSHEGRAAKPVRLHAPKSEWSVHPTMRKSFKEGGSGVVMAARCQGHLVGWFSPAAADIMFLSSAYVEKQHESDPEWQDNAQVTAVEVLDRDWQKGSVW